MGTFIPKRAVETRPRVKEGCFRIKTRCSDSIQTSRSQLGAIPKRVTLPNSAESNTAPTEPIQLSSTQRSSISTMPTCRRSFCDINLQLSVTNPSHFPKPIFSNGLGKWVSENGIKPIFANGPKPIFQGAENDFSAENPFWKAICTLRKYCMKIAPFSGLSFSAKSRTRIYPPTQGLNLGIWSAPAAPFL